MKLLVTIKKTRTKFNSNSELNLYYTINQKIENQKSFVFKKFKDFECEI